MKDFFIDTGITALLFFPLFFLVFAVLWRLKANGAYTLLLGFFFEIVTLLVGFAVAPQAMRYHHGVGTPPVAMRIGLGCIMPMVFMAVYHMAQDQNRRKKMP